MIYNNTSIEYDICRWLIVNYAKLNVNRISEKIADIKESIHILSDYASQEDNSFLNNKEAIRSARYTLIVLVEAATNIASHICARLLAKSPANYAEGFLMLGQNNIIDDNLSKRLGKMAGFRNLLVHGYGEIDNKRMLEIMRKNICDVESYGLRSMIF